MHDERLWMPIARRPARGQQLVPRGTPEQVAQRVLEYDKLGVGSVLIRGFDPFEDTIDSAAS